MVDIPEYIDYTKYVKMLKRANIPQDERFKLLRIIGDLTKSGLSNDNMDRLVQEITKSSEFKIEFLENSKKAMSKIGL